MGGISGVRGFSTGAVATDTLRRMAELLRHRGPGGSGIWMGADIGLAHNRPGTTDDEHEHQPMQSPDGRWSVALDGWVANHESLRGHVDQPLRSASAAEVVAAGLALEGISFVERLRGEFALVAHDLRTDTTHLVRDPLGVRPLYYRHIPGGIAFGSEVKALLAVGPPPQVDHRSLDAYLTDRVVPAPDTLFEGVKKVRPGHRVAVMPGGHLEEVPHWPATDMDPDGTWSPQDAVEAVGDGVREAVRSALTPEVPVGVLLSGGLGSSLVAAHVRQLRGDDPVHTFTADVDGHARPQDVLPWARRVSSLLGTHHHEVRLRAADVEELWPRLTWHRDAPLSEPSDIVTHVLACATRQHVPVALAGEGGHELFGGPSHHRMARLAERSTALPPRWRSGITGSRLVMFSTHERQRLLGTGPPADRRAPVPLGADPVDRMLRHDLRHRLPDDSLERWDRMGMSASLDVRLPLLDQRLVELAFRLPSSVKMRAGTSTWALKEAARLVLPDEAIDRRRTGARLPLGAWLRDGLRDTARDRLTGSDSWVGQTLDRALVRDLVDRHERGAGEEMRLWTLLALEMWHDCFFSSPPRVPLPRIDSRSDLPLTPGRSGS